MQNKYRSIKNTIKLLSLATIAVVSSIGAFAAGIGLVDSNRVTTEYSKAIEAQKKADQYETELKNSLKQASDELEKLSKNAAATEAQKKDKTKQAQDKFNADRKRIETAVVKLKEEIYSEIKDAITEEAKAQSLDMVVPASVSLYGGKDITDDVVKRLNASSPAAKPAKATTKKK
jgi:Skp family chaperone for outer membrane proteins